MVIERVQSIHGVSGWSKIRINSPHQQSSFWLNSSFSSFRQHSLERIQSHQVVSRGSLPIVTGVTKFVAHRLLTSTCRPSSIYDRLHQVFIGEVRGMSASSEIEAQRPPAATSVENTKKASVNIADDDLNGLENEFQSVVKIYSDEAVSSEKNDDEEEEGKSPPKSSTILSGKIDSKDSKNAPTKTLVDNLKVSKSLRRIASLIDDAKNILILSGAGVSVAAGIPDFRTPGTGLYDNLQKYNLPYAEAVFDIQYYQMNPKPFIQLAAELWPDRHVPTITHSFIALLANKERLLRNYTQNIDGLESMAGVPEDLIVECHGHFRTASCIRCKKAASIEVVKETIVNRQDVPMCTHCTKVNGSSKKRPAYVKPDIVFFGEGLPSRFHDMLPSDTEMADLCIVLGTSLQVPPTAYIPDMVYCPRILLNREYVGNFKISDDDDVDDYNRDLFESGNCDESIMTIAQILGWDKELREKHNEMIKTFTGKTKTVVS